MTQPFADALTWVPKSRTFAATLAEANDLARAQGHGAVTLEHLLLALLEDADAAPVLKACRLDLDQTAADVGAYIAGLPKSDSPIPAADPGLLRILEYGAAAARQSGRREVTGAIVLAAIVGEGKSEAAALLQRRGLTFQDTVKALQQAATVPRPQKGGEEVGKATPPAGPTSGPPALPAAETASKAAAAGEAMPEGRRPASPIGTEVEAAGTAEQTMAPPAAGPPPLPPAVAGEQATAVRDDPPARPASAVVDAGEAATHANADVLTTARRRIEAVKTGAPLPPMPAPGIAAARATSRADGDASGWTPAMRSPAGQAGGRGAARMPPPVPPLAGPPPIVSRGNGSEHGEIRIERAEAPWEGAERPAVRVAGLPQSSLSSPGGRAGAAAPLDIEAMADAIPERMRIGIASVVEIRVPRAAAAGLGLRDAEAGWVQLASTDVRTAVTLRLRGAPARFHVELLTPETCWVEAVDLALADEHLVWRWVVTPRVTGRQALRLATEVRRFGGGHGGIAGGGETALPEYEVDVTVAPNRVADMRRLAGWLVAAAVGVVMARLLDGPISAMLAELARLARG